MAFYISPSVNTQERDDTLAPNEISDNIGALAGAFRWGPVDEPTLILSGISELEQKFYTPNDETYLPFLVATDFLSYTNKAWITRVAGDATSNAVPTGMTPVLVKNESDFANQNLVGYQFLAKYPGAVGNGLSISIADDQTFGNWEFKNQFDYAPRLGEFSVAVVDGSGAFTGSGATRQAERLVISGAAKGGVQQKVTVNVSGVAAGGIKQQERLTVLGTATGTSITVAGVDVVLEVDDNQNTVALKIAEALLADVDALFESAYATNNQIFLTYSDYGAKTPTTPVTSIGLTISTAVTVTGNDNFSITLYGKTINLINGHTAEEATTRIVNVFAGDVGAFKEVTSIDADSFHFTYVDYGDKAIVASQVLNGLTVTSTKDIPGESDITINVFGNTVAIEHKDTSAAVATKIAAVLQTKLVTLGIENVVVSKNTITYNYPEIGVQTAKQTPIPQSGLEFDVDVITPGRSGTILERFEILNRVKGSKFADGRTQYYVDAINDASQYIYVGDASIIVSTGLTVLAGAVDDNLTVNPTAAYQNYVNSEELDVNYIIDTGNPAAIQKAIADVALTRKDCFAFLSPNFNDVVNNKGNEVRDVLEWRNTRVNRESSYLINDCNWGYVYDKYNDTYRWIPCSGGTAGIKARTDNDAEPWTSPAGYEYGRYKNYIKVAWSPSQGQRDELYKAAVNPIVSFKGEGIVLYGDKTSLIRPSAFQGINVRSAFIVAQKSLANFAKYYLFKINDEFTRAQFTNAVRPFLRGMKARRAFEDFRFISDERNNGGAVRQARKMVATILIRPAYSINWIDLQFTAVGAETSFEEIESTLN